MRDLDSTNPVMAKPAKFASAMATLPVALSACSFALADGAAPSIPFAQNPISLFLCAVLAVSCVMFLVPRVCSWNWEAKYFGATLIYSGSISLICLVPWVCLLLYGNLPVGVRACAFLIFITVHVRWCRRFVLHYKKITNDSESRALLYEEEEDAVYYMQRADKWLFEKRYKLDQIPTNGYFVIFFLLPFLLIPIMGQVSKTVGLPFVHIFLAIGTMPMSLMGVGLASRGWLVFFHYPAQIKKSTGKRVYVDMSGKPNLAGKGKRLRSDHKPKSFQNRG